jgi:hypothetical protein
MAAIEDNRQRKQEEREPSHINWYLLFRIFDGMKVWEVF